ncbi:MAG TPA: erythromycin esterase family protein, partial [Methylomirabilota bacterium]|nr:erythromycin esterase family protein [Methylomirabilota bacterium]
MDAMNALAKLIREAAQPLTGSPKDYDPLLDLIGDTRFVLLGEATHGTHEFYRERAQITKRLIKERGFMAVAVEADWPDAYRVNRFVCGESEDAEAVDALGGFKRFPAWMWRNADVLDFVGWLRAHNDSLRAGAEKVGFYGLDLYSLRSSIEAVLAYLYKVDAASARRARNHYACFDHFGKDTQTYGLATGLGMSKSCEQEVVNELTELRLREVEYLQRDGRVAADEFFFAEQNARLIKNAEQYYRSMFRGPVSSWNLRDHHMVETLDNLEAHLKEQRQKAKIVVWAHNSHLGDARATEMSDRGEFNVGQLVRQKHDRGAVLVGFTTHSGTVTAASEWDAPAERKQVRPALEESFEAVFHELPYPRFMLSLRDDESEAAFNLRVPRLERAIGV